MAIGSNRIDAFRGGPGPDQVAAHLAFNPPGRDQRGGGSEEHVGRSVADGAKADPMLEESDGWVRAGLAESDVFGALRDEDLDQLIGQGRTATYPGGAIVFRKGEPAREVMVVLRGRIRLSSLSRHGREVLFDLIGPGRCFGEVALIEGTKRKLDATAVKPSAIFVLRSRDVLACLEAHPEVAVRVIRILCTRLSRAMEMLEDRTQLGLSSRSARVLLRLAREHGDGTRIGLRISQGKIAGLIGATRERVNRQLCAWCRSGILAVDEGHLTILDHGALHAIAEDE